MNAPKNFQDLAARATIAALVFGTPGQTPVLLYLDKNGDHAFRQIKAAVERGMRSVGLLALLPDGSLAQELSDMPAAAELMKAARPEFYAGLALANVPEGKFARA